MLSVCENFASQYGLLFNARKTQLIRFTSTMPTLDLRVGVEIFNYS